MREIKIRYRIRSKNFPNIIDTDIVFLEQIEKGYISDIYKGCEILSRDLFTTLFDKNKKEIYNADIVKIDEKDMYEVCWDLISGCWSLRRNRKLEPDFPTREDGKVYYGYTFYKAKENCEVIGNIYDNPDLLKQ